MTDCQQFKRRMSPENLKKLREAQRAKFYKENATRIGTKKHAARGEQLREPK